MAVSDLEPQVVGALRCQKDSYQRTFATEVVYCREYNRPPTQPSKMANKHSKDHSKDLSGNSQPQSYAIECADSVIFPEGGGQPCDYGTLTPLSLNIEDEPQDPIQITNVQRQGLRCVHLSPVPLEPGTRVWQEVDWVRRWDHMQQHTGQHLLSAVLDQMNLPTVGWSMGAPGEMNYIELPRKPNDEEIAEVQQKCNKIIQENMEINVEVPGQGSSSLPKDYDAEKGVVRFIKIGDLDYNACCGTHLKQTSHIQVLLLHNTHPIRGTNTRLFFSAGERAIGLATRALSGLRQLGVALSCGSGPGDVISHVERLDSQVSDLRKKNAAQKKELAMVEAARIRNELEIGHRPFSWRPDGGLEFVNFVVKEINVMARKRGLVVLCEGQIGGGGAIVIIGMPRLVAEMAAKTKELVKNVKGGGMGEKWQGKVGMWEKGEVDALRMAVERSSEEDEK